MKKKGKTKKYTKIIKRICPFCDSHRLYSSPHILYGRPLTSMKFRGFVERFYYKCEDCGKILYSLKDLK